MASTAIGKSRQIGRCGAYEIVARISARKPEKRFASEIIRGDCRPLQQPPTCAAHLDRVPVDVAFGYLNLRTGPGMRHTVVTRMPAGATHVSIGACLSPDDGGRFP